jgi:hypothetical protein
VQQRFVDILCSKFRLVRERLVEVVQQPPERNSIDITSPGRRELNCCNFIFHWDKDGIRMSQAGRIARHEAHTGTGADNYQNLHQAVGLVAQFGLKPAIRQALMMAWFMRKNSHRCNRIIPLTLLPFLRLIRSRKTYP